MTSSIEAVNPAEYNPRHIQFKAARPGMLDWARRRKADKEAKRLATAGQRAATRLDPWPDWHVVDVPRLTKPASDRASFLAIGPGGVFAVSVLEHGRARVLLAGDVIQINGRRPPYVAEARRDATRASTALSKVVGTKVPVVPVLALVGTGPVSYYGLPKDCLVTTHRELDKVLASRGERMTPTTATKLSAVARHPTTWGSSDNYRWYTNGTAAADKKPTQR